MVIVGKTTLIVKFLSCVIQKHVYSYNQALGSDTELLNLAFHNKVKVRIKEF